MLSLIELQRKKVEAKRKKYDKDEMDSYLELVYENYRELLDQIKKLEAEKGELNQKVKKLSDGVQYYRSIETTLQKALILAEKTSKETKDAALLKAEAIEKDANKRADEILRNAEGEYNIIKGKCVHLVQQFNQYKTRLIEAASAQLELVEGDEFDIAAPDEYGQAPNSPVKQKETEFVPKPDPIPDPEPVPEVEPEAQAVSQELAASKKPTTEEILRADTIDLRTTLDTIQSFEQAAVTESSFPEAGQPIEMIVNDPMSEDMISNDRVIEEEGITHIPVRTFEDTPVQEAVFEPVENQLPEHAVSHVKEDNRIDTVNVKHAQPIDATFIEPIQAKTVEPLDAIFEDELAANEERAKEPIKLNPTAKEPETVPTLDALLQDLNINNRGNQKSDDPFEFLGSIDDDF